MKKLNLKWTAVVAIAVLFAAVLLTSCSKSNVYEPNVSEATHQLKQEKITNTLRWFVIDGTGGLLLMVLEAIVLLMLL
jgi:hypothetical protein